MSPRKGSKETPKSQENGGRDPAEMGRVLMKEMGVDASEMDKAFSEDMNVSAGGREVPMGPEARKALAEVEAMVGETPTPTQVEEPPSPGPAPAEEPGSTEGEEAPAPTGEPEENSAEWYKTKIGEMANKLGELEGQNKELLLKMAEANIRAQPQDEGNQDEQFYKYLFGDAWDKESEYGDPLKDQPLFQFLGQVLARQTQLSANMVAGVDEKVTSVQEGASLSAMGLDKETIAKIEKDPEFSYIEGLRGDARKQALKMAMKIKGEGKGESAPSRTSSTEPKKKILAAPFVESHSGGGGGSGQAGGGAVVGLKAKFDQALQGGDERTAREIAQAMMKRTGVSLF